jgi:hypothetical protein
LIAQAEVLNQHNRDTFTTPFPKAPSRWLSHYEFTPHPIELTSQGNVDGDLSWLVGTTLDFSFTRALCAPHYGTRGGRCDDPASLVMLEVAAKVDAYVDDAHFCMDLHHTEKGRRSRQLAGLHGSVPGAGDLCHFRYRDGGIAVFDSNRRNAHIAETSLLHRGDDQNGTPSAPWGRFCHSNGYDYHAQSRQDVCGLQCPPEEQTHCPHRYGVRGSCHRMRFTDHPRLIAASEKYEAEREVPIA